MGNQIIKQPNGKYAVFSSIVEGFTMYDASRKDIIEAWVSEERACLTDKVNRICDTLDAGENAYFQFQKSWDEALRLHRRHFPDEKIKLDKTKPRR